jgi:hypothetical protein
MTAAENYGKCVENPVVLNSIPASIIFLNNLVTDKGYHIVYHRQGSVSWANDQIIDHYEVMSTDNCFADLYISIYSESSLWIPPPGYLFAALPEIMCSQLMEREELEELDEEDIVDFDEKYVFIDPMPDDFEFDDLVESNKLLPPLERFVFDSFGTNQRTENFPYNLIHDHFRNVYQYSSEDIEKLLSVIQPRANK